MSCSQFKSLSVFKHHIKKDICASRSKYREGRKDTAVKVYTINQESFYLILTNVPAIGGGEELRALCDQSGLVEEFKPLDDYPSEEFTEAYLVKYSTFSSARSAKKYLDDKSFFGGVLHVFYAPEFETLQETRLKLQERRKYIAWKTNSGKKQTVSTGQSNQTFHSKVHPENSVASSCKSSNLETKPVSYVWAGKEYFVTPPSVEKSHSEIPSESKTTGLFIPRQCQSNAEQNSSKCISTPNKIIFSSTSSIPIIKDDPSYELTVSEVRAKVSRVSVPNVRVSLKRKKRL